METRISRQRRHEVLFRHNHSNYYVDTLMKKYRTGSLKVETYS